MIISKKHIETKIMYVNLRYKTNFDYNYNAHYGGYKLTSNNGSHDVRGRMSGRELFQFLDGLILGYDHIKEIQSL